MSSSMALRRSPKPGALTAQTWSVPRSLFTTRVARASPSMSSAMMRSCLPCLAVCSSTGRRSFIEEIFFSKIRIRAFSRTASILSASVTKYGREVAAVELHPLDDLEGRLEALGLLDRDDAVLADLVHRLGDDLADLLVAVGGDGADEGDLLGVDALLELVDRLDGLLHGDLDAALELHRVVAGGDHLDPLAVDGLREDRGGRRAVAGDVGGLGGDLADHLGAHVLERVGQLDLLGDGDAVLGDQGRAELLLDDDVAALGAEGDLDRVGQLVDAAEDAWRASSP